MKHNFQLTNKTWLWGQYSSS